MTTNDMQGWKGGCLSAYTTTGRKIWSVTRTNSVPFEFYPHMPLGQVGFGWSAPSETVSQMAFVIFLRFL